jgi:membrane protein
MARVESMGEGKGMAGIIASMNVPLALRARWRQRVSELLATLQRWPWIDTLRTLRQRFREDRLGLTAGSLTFTTTIALVPLATVTLAVFTAFPMFARFRGSLEKYFLQALVPDNIAKPVLRALTEFALQANRLGTAGLIVLVITALALMLTIDRTLNAIWRVRKSRPIAQRVLVYWAAATLGPLLLGISLTLTSYAISASRGLVGAMPGGVSVVLNSLEFLALAAAMSALFHYVPNTPVRWGHAWAGGLFVSLGIEVAKKVLTWYLSTVPSYSTVYGAFATVPIFLVWLYLGWVIVLLGAVIAAYAPSLSMQVVRRPSSAGHAFQLAVLVLRELARARDLSMHGISALKLSEASRLDPLQIEPLLETLVEMDWIARLDEESDPRFVLLCDPASTPAQPLLAKFLLDPDPVVRGFWQRAGFSELTLSQVLTA